MNSSLPEVCGEKHSLDDQFLKSVRFWGPGVAVSVIGVIGLIGNVLSIVAILTMQKSRISLFYKLLVTLGIFDVLFISNGGLFMIQQAFNFNVTWYNILFPKLIYPISGFAMTGSTYSCMLIAVERYLGICHSNVSARFRKLRYYMVVLVLACFAIDTPRFFEIEALHDEAGNYVRFQYTSLRRNRSYIMVYFMWYRLITTVALPFLTMMFCNLRVFLYYKRNNLQVEAKHERTLLIIFTCISATFIICHAPRMVLNVYEFKMDKEREECQLLAGEHARYTRPKWTFVLACIEKVLLIFNASANFVYYCFAGREFRSQFCRTLICCVKMRPLHILGGASITRKYSLKTQQGNSSETQMDLHACHITHHQKIRCSGLQQVTRKLLVEQSTIVSNTASDTDDYDKAHLAALEEIERWNRFVKKSQRMAISSISNKSPPEQFLMLQTDESIVSCSDEPKHMGVFM